MIRKIPSLHFSTLPFILTIIKWPVVGHDELSYNENLYNRYCNLYICIVSTNLLTVSFSRESQLRFLLNSSWNFWRRKKKEKKNVRSGHWMMIRQNPRWPLYHRRVRDMDTFGPMRLLDDFQFYCSFLPLFVFFLHWNHSLSWETFTFPSQICVPAKLRVFKYVNYIARLNYFSP